MEQVLLMFKEKKEKVNFLKDKYLKENFPKKVWINERKYYY